MVSGPVKDTLLEYLIAFFFYCVAQVNSGSLHCLRMATSPASTCQWPPRGFIVNVK